MLVLQTHYVASPTQWMWVWASSGSWWWTGKPGMLQSTRSQRVGHNWVTKLNWITQIFMASVPIGIFLLSSSYGLLMTHLASYKAALSGPFTGSFSKWKYKGQWRKEMDCPFLSSSQVNIHQLVIHVQFSSVAQLCPTLFNPMNCSTPGLPVYHQLPEFTQIHVHWVGDTIRPSHPLLSPSPPALDPSQHQGLFKWVSSSRQGAKVLEFQLQHQFFQWTPRTDLL